MDERNSRFSALFQKLRYGGGVLALALIIVFAAALLRPEEEARDTARDGALLRADAALVQTMRFTLCQHQVTRRVTVPQACVGIDRAGLEKVYADWRLETFSETEAQMTRDVDLFCPLHYVLMANETGGLAAYQNRYGDAMAWLEDVDGRMSDYDEQTQEKLLRGIGFDSMEELRAALQTGLD